MMNVDELAARTNDLIREGAMDAAAASAAECVKAILRDDAGIDAVVSFGPKQSIGVSSERHVIFRLQAKQAFLAIPIDMVHGTFSNNVNSFRLVAALVNSYPVRQVTDGWAVIDLEDATNAGRYRRASFSSPLPKSELVVDTYYVQAKGYAALRAEIDAGWVPWLDRKKSVFWRGATTGLKSPIPSPDAWHWRWLPRLHLCEVASQSRFADRLDIGVFNLAQIHGESTRLAITSSGFMRPRVPRMAFIEHRYVVDIDGNGNAWNGLFGALLMGSCILKVASPHGWRQWYYDRLIPHVHFLPVKSDLSDFDDVVEWAFSHPDESAEIGRRARQFALSLNYEDELDLSGARLARLLMTGGKAHPPVTGMPHDNIHEHSKNHAELF